MQLIYDHLIATILGVATFFILISVHVRGIETSHDQVYYYTAKRQLASLTEMIQHDFENIGFGVDPDQDIFVASTDSTLSFMAKVNKEDTAPSTFLYRRAQVGTTEIDEETAPLYEVQRYVDGVLTGKSAPYLREFVMELRDADRQEVYTFDDVEAVYVRCIVTSPLGGKDGLHEAHWMRTIIPPNLTSFE